MRAFGRSLSSLVANREGYREGYRGGYRGGYQVLTLGVTLEIESPLIQVARCNGNEVSHFVSGVRSGYVWKEEL